jgi:hypothetical protein
MRLFRRREDVLRALDGELRARRSEAPRDFVRSLAERARPEGHGRLRPGVRLSLTFALVGAALVAVASAGGFSEVTATTSHTVKTVFHRIVQPAKPQPARPSLIVLARKKGPPHPPPADDQYKKQCGPSPSKKCKAHIKPGHANVAEGGCVSLNVDLDKPSAGGVTVHWATKDGPGKNGAKAGQDYTAASDTATFGQGVKSQSIGPICTLVDGDNKEKNEHFSVELTGGSNADAHGHTEIQIRH